MTTRKRAAGTVLHGRAAKLSRAAHLRARGHMGELLDDLVAAVGLPGQQFVVGSCSLPARAVPDDLKVFVDEGEADACARLAAYHLQLCGGKPETQVGREAGLAVGWAAPAQRLAVEGKTSALGRKCNMVVSVVCDSECFGILALGLQLGRRKCVVQTLHVLPRYRGPMQLPGLMWEKAKEVVAERARTEGVFTVEFTLELPCCQSRQGAAFWIGRMGWDGTEDARRAAREYTQAEHRPSVGEYIMWKTLRVSSSSTIRG